MPPYRTILSNEEPYLTPFSRQYSHNRNIAETLAPIGKLSENYAHIYQTLLIAYLEKNASLSLI